MAVGGPSRRLTAKTLKYYGPTYIKSVLHTSSAASLLLTQEHGVWPENSMLAVAGSAETEYPPQPLAAAPATTTRKLWQGWEQRDSSKQHCQHVLAPACPCPAGPLRQAQLTKFS